MHVRTAILMLFIATSFQALNAFPISMDQQNTRFSNSFFFLNINENDLLSGNDYDILQNENASIPSQISSSYAMIMLLAVFLIVWIIYVLRLRNIKHSNEELKDSLHKKNKELEFTKNAIERIVENAGSAIVTVDMDERVTTWNKRSEQVFSFAKADMIGKKISTLNLKDDPNPFSEILAKVQQEGELYQLELKKKSAKDKIVELVITITQISSEKDDKFAFILSMDDFSARNRLIDDVIDREKLIASIEALNKLMGTLSHHINNSIMAISSMAQLAALDDNYHQKFAQITEKQIHRIQAVLESLSQLVQKLNLKTRDYVGEKDRLFDIEAEIKEFMNLLEKAKKNSEEVE